MKLAAIVIGASLLGTVAASAQGVELRVNPGLDRGYVERDGDYRRDRDWRDGRAQYRDRDRDTVIVKKRRGYERSYDRYDEPRPGIVIQR
jgi:hypothetical protein